MTALRFVVLLAFFDPSGTGEGCSDTVRRKLLCSGLSDILDDSVDTSVPFLLLCLAF
jgi:hypothetical protein